MKLVKGLLFSLVLLSCSGVAIVPASAAVDIGVGINIGPPAPRYEVVPAPRPGYYWRAGHWFWNGSQYVWRPGYFVARPAGYYNRAWIPGHWVHRPAGWFFVEGHWR
jgi:hypothetical protein